MRNVKKLDKQINNQVFKKKQIETFNLHFSIQINTNDRPYAAFNF